MIEVEEEYNQAAVDNDEDLMKTKMMELNSYQSSLMLTAYMFAEVDEVST
tara:strand:+ start:1323 stop:1472 length:150 start_codon:yes stop_codon:yes gene_type:complete